jgi:hypothetical protein
LGRFWFRTVPNLSRALGRRKSRQLDWHG